MRAILKFGHLGLGVKLDQPKVNYHRPPNDYPFCGWSPHLNLSNQAVSAIKDKRKLLPYPGTGTVLMGMPGTSPSWALSVL
jgi:hypothetical protein